MFVGLVLGFVAGLYVAWNFWQQPEVVKDVVTFVHRKVNDVASTAKQKIKEKAEDKKPD